jgi:FtsH-binding integral membrane protein
MFKVIFLFILDYIKSVYQYVASGLVVTGASAVLSVRSGIAYRLFSFNPIVSSLCFFGALIGSQMLLRSIPKDNVIPKYLAFGLFNGVMGLTLSGLCFYQPQILLKAGLYTLGIMGALSFTVIFFYLLFRQ